MPVCTLTTWGQGHTQFDQIMPPFHGMVGLEGIGVVSPSWWSELGNGRRAKLHALQPIALLDVHLGPQLSSHLQVGKSGFLDTPDGLNKSFSHARPGFVTNLVRSKMCCEFRFCPN